eukprot:scaffold266403_cov17-Tisochrysis_lutea.AAC.1
MGDMKRNPDYRLQITGCFSILNTPNEMLTGPMRGFLHTAVENERQRCRFLALAQAQAFNEYQNGM